ncbi:MAG: GGDEF domain-containing protein [Verrucomicrobia bacterium]|nr:GGDEF domain-containing protein [Verrucomicrobiota bacterium]
MGNDLFQRLKSSNRLPSPPGVALKILELARSDDTSLDDLAKVISSDPALASRMLKFVNSPSAGFGRQIATLDEAVNQIGLRGVQLMALSFSLVSSGRVEVSPSFNFDMFWSRSLACAVASKTFAMHAGRMDPNEAFIIGLLYHIGQMAAACAVPELYEPVLVESLTRPRELLVIEKEKLGATHIEAGVQLLQDWKLPDSIWQTIATSQDPKAPTTVNGRITSSRVLYIGDVTAALLCDSKEERSGKVEEILKLVLEHFEIDEAAWTELYDQIIRDWKAYGQLLSVKAGTDKSFRDLQEEAREKIAALSAATVMENIGIKGQNQQLQQQVRTDALTGVSNRAAFDERLAGELERARRTQCPLALCLLDIDHFKKFNDTHGHQVGDQVLQAVAKALDETIRKMDLVARYGGEEFAVIAPECAPSKAGSLAERLREAVEEIQLEVAGQKLRVTTSIGVAFAQWPGYERTAAELIKTADAKLYEAKRGGRNCCRLEEALKQAA